MYFWDVREKKVWFSHRARVYYTEGDRFCRKKDMDIWDWDQLTTISLVRTFEGGLRLVFRRTEDVESTYMASHPPRNALSAFLNWIKRRWGKEEGKKVVKLRYMLGFDLKRRPTLYLDPSYVARRYRWPNKWTMEGPKDRVVLQFDEDHFLWQWKNEGDETILKDLYHRLIELRSSYRPVADCDNIFEIELNDENGLCLDNCSVKDYPVLPVIYQPAVDALKNFVREVHCSYSRGCQGEAEVTIIFENEKLRRHSFHGVIDILYRVIRWLVYGRNVDVESFKVHFSEDLRSRNMTCNGLTFEGIYSGQKKTLLDDDVHNDPKPASPHRIKYYVGCSEGEQRCGIYNRPVVFVNTSNHAMAEHDTNYDIWKWEYIPWSEDRPFFLGNKNRDEVEREFLGLKRFIPKAILKFLKYLMDLLQRKNECG